MGKLNSNLGGPFQAALDAGVELHDLVHLALVFRCAHTDSDVWAGCRLLRAIGRYKDAGIAPLLSGCHFARHIVDSDSFDDLSVLRMDAEDFLAKHTEF